MEHNDFLAAITAVEQRTQELLPDVEAELSAAFADASTQAVSTLVAAADWQRPDADEAFDKIQLQLRIENSLNDAQKQLDYSLMAKLGTNPGSILFDTTQIAAATVSRYRDKVSETLLFGWNDGLTVDQMAEQLSLVGQSSGQLIARTTMNGMSNATSLAGALYAEVEWKVWLATEDERTRDSHVEIDGEQVPVDAEFSNGLRFPGDPSGPPEEVWNCRCTLTYPQAPLKEPVEEAALPVVNPLGHLTPTTEIADRPPALTQIFHPGDVKSADVQAALKGRSQAELLSRLRKDPEWQPFVAHIARIGSKALDEQASEFAFELSGPSDMQAIEEAAEMREYIGTWANSSSDTNLLSLRFQAAAAEEFGIPISRSLEELIFAANGGRPIWDGVPFWVRTSMRRFVRAQYALTQEAFAAKGIETVKLYRGMGLPTPYEELGIDPYADLHDPRITGGVNSQRAIESNPLSSWTTNPNTAMIFALGDDIRDSAYVLTAEVPVSRIMGSPISGFGCVNEYEFVLLGGEDTVMFWSRDGFRQAFLESPPPSIEEVTKIMQDSIEQANAEAEKMIEEGNIKQAWED